MARCDFPERRCGRGKAGEFYDTGSLLSRRRECFAPGAARGRGLSQRLFGSLLRREPCPARADQAGIGGREAPEGAAVGAHEIDRLVVGATEREVGR